MRELGIGDANQLSRVAQIRAFVDHTQAEVQKVLNQNTQAQHNDRVMPDAFIDNTARLQEEFLRRKQMYKYMDRLRELTQGGMPMLQAQLIAKQETGYSG
jgi:translation initiation factor 2 alpha subunit (eIF-2alpha)